MHGGQPGMKYNSRAPIIGVFMIITLLVLQGLQLPGLTEERDLDQRSSVQEQHYPTEDAKLALSNINGYFIENNGQIDDPDIYYYHYQESLGIGFLEGAYILTLMDERNLTSVVQVHFQGSNPVIPVGLDPQDHTTNYFLGNDPNSWATDITNFGSVAYHDLYQGIDLKFYFTKDGLKYDWIVGPGADPSSIGMLYEGVKDLYVGSDGTLAISTEVGIITEERPFSYQEVQGTISEVGTSYRVQENNMVSYDLGEYNPNHQLIIDPLVGCTYISGGSELETGNAVKTDAENNIYIVGSTWSKGFPTTPGCYEYDVEVYNIFIMKFDPRLSTLIYSSVIGGDLQDNANDVDVDADGNAYVVGATRSSGFPFTEGAYNTTPPSGSNICFIFKMNPLGNQLIYSTFVPGILGSEILLDSERNVYVAGSNYHNYSSDSFVFKLNADGSDVISSISFGGDQLDMGLELAMDHTGDIYVAGDTLSANFPTTPGCFDETVNGEDIHLPSYKNEIFVTKIKGDLSGIIYSTYIGGTKSDKITGLVVDSQGDAIISGYTISEDYPVTEGCYMKNYTGAGDCIVTKLNHNGSALVYSSYIGSPDGEHEQSQDIGINSKDQAYVYGHTYSHFWPTTVGCWGPYFTGGGRHDLGCCFIDVFEPNGNRSYSTYASGSGEDFSVTITVDSNDNAVTVGKIRLEPCNLPTTHNSYDPLGSMNDAFCLVVNLTVEPSVTIGSILPNPALLGEPVTLTGKVISDSYLSNCVWTMDGVEVYNGTDWEYTTDGLENGTYIVEFRVQNEAGYWSNIASSRLIVHKRPESVIDTVSPNPTLDVHPIKFTGAGIDDGTIEQYSWRIGSEYFNGFYPEFTYSGLTAGLLTVGLRVQDNYGIWSYEATTQVTVVSRVVGEILLISPSPTSDDTNVTFRCGSEDGRETIRVSWISSIDGEFYNGTETEIEVIGFSLGSHEITLRVQDNYGFWSNRTSTWLEVTQRPIAVIENIHPNPALISDTIHFTGAENTNGSIARYLWESSIDGILFNGTESDFQIDTPTQGTHTISHMVQDGLGFWSDPIFMELVVTQRPVAIIDSIGPDVVTSDSHFLFLGNGTDDGTVVSYAWRSSVDGELISCPEVTASFTGLSPAAHIITLKVCDDLGFWSEEVTTSLLVHQRPAVTIVSVNPSITVLSEPIDIIGSAMDDNMIISYRWISDIDGILSEESQFSTPSLSRGEHTITFEVMDEYGSWSPQARTMVIIMERPVSVITNVSHSLAVEGTLISFQGYGSDDGIIRRHIWTSSIDRLLSEEKSFSTSNLTPGNHIVYYRVMDEHGLWSKEKSFSIIIHQRPVADILSVAPQTPSKLDIVTLSGEGTDDGEIVRYIWRSSLDGEIFNGTWEVAICGGLGVGNHTIYFKVQDDHGIWSEEAAISLEVRERRVEVNDEDNEGASSSIFMMTLALLIVLIAMLVVVVLTPNSKF